MKLDLTKILFILFAIFLLCTTVLAPKKEGRKYSTSEIAKKVKELKKMGAGKQDIDRAIEAMQRK